MFIEKCVGLAKPFVNKRVYIKYILLLAIPFTLFIKPVELTLYSMESMFSNHQFFPRHEFLAHSKPFHDASPSETIFIKVEGSMAFVSNVKHWTEKLKVRSKSIVVSSEPQKNYYFVTIYLKESNKDRNVVFPLRRYQPNSDLLFLAYSIFKTEMRFSYRNIFPCSFEQSIYLTLKNDKESIIKLCSLLRYYSNIYSHALGIYYYIPLSQKVIKHESFVLFIIISLLLFIVNDISKINISTALLKITIFYLFPPSCIFCIKSKEKPILSLFFIAIDVNFGLFYILLEYLILLIQNFNIVSKKSLIYQRNFFDHLKKINLFESAKKILR